MKKIFKQNFFWTFKIKIENFRTLFEMSNCSKNIFISDKTQKLIFVFKKIGNDKKIKFVLLASVS